MLSLNITEHNLFYEINEYINSLSNNQHITVKMLKKKFNIQPKHAHRILKNHKNTMLATPYEYGCYKNKNYNLYKKLDNESLKDYCEVLKSKTKNFNEHSFNQVLMNNHRINI